MLDERLDHGELAALVEELHAADSTGETAEQVIAYLCQTLKMDEAGVTMIRGRGRLTTVAATGDGVSYADAFQAEIGEGPWVSDLWDDSLRCPDLGLETRWPRWAQALCDRGIASLLAVSLAPQGDRIGVVTLYSRTPRAFDDDDVALTHLFARHAAIALANAEQEENLRIALDARKLIGQAQGILMERFGLDEPRAFEVLKRYSQHHNLRLRAVAELLVETRNLPPMD